MQRLRGEAESGRVANARQPGAGNSWKPVNSLNSNSIADRHNPAYGRNKPTTYSKLNRNTKSIGTQRGRGQQGYLERNPEYSPSTSYNYSVSHASPLKRRKTEHTTAERAHSVQEIEDSDGDEIQEVAPPARQATPGACSAMSSRSPRSATTRQAATGAKLGSQPTSEFANLDKFLNPKRNPRPRRPRSKGPGEHRRESRTESALLGAGSPSRETVYINDDDFETPRTARSLILQDFKQGVKPKSTSNDQQHSRGRVTSSHFPVMRINESCADMDDGMVSQIASTSKDLRDYRPAQCSASDVGKDPIEDSEDELAQSAPNSARAGPKQSPSKILQTKRITAKRKTTTEKSYQLEYARSYDVEPDSLRLTLEPTENPKDFRIMGHDLNGKSKLLKMLKLASVNRIVSDDVRSMRLVGPVANGNKYWCDLTFANFLGFQHFRDTFVYPEVANKARSVVSK